MNETVKGILRFARADLVAHVSEAEGELRYARDRAAYREQILESYRNQLAELEAALTEGGVDLAAENAKASAAFTGQNSIASGLGQAMSSLGQMDGCQSAASHSQLARAIDEA